MSILCIKPDRKSRLTTNGPTRFTSLSVSRQSVVLRLTCESTGRSFHVTMPRRDFDDAVYSYQRACHATTKG